MEWIMRDLTRNQVQQRLENVVLCIQTVPLQGLFHSPRHVCFGLFSNVKVYRPVPCDRYFFFFSCFLIFLPCFVFFPLLMSFSFLKKWGDWWYSLESFPHHSLQKVKGYVSRLIYGKLAQRLDIGYHITKMEGRSQEELTLWSKPSVTARHTLIPRRLTCSPAAVQWRILWRRTSSRPLANHRPSKSRGSLGSPVKFRL